MRVFGIFVCAATLATWSASAATTNWVLEQESEGFQNTETVSAYIVDKNAKLMLRCENKDRIMVLYQPGNVLSEGGILSTRYRIGKKATVKSNEWISLYGIAAYWGAKKTDKNRGQIVAFAQSLMDGTNILIESENERARFSLEGSKSTIKAVLAACGVA